MVSFYMSPTFQNNDSHYEDNENENDNVQINESTPLLRQSDDSISTILNSNASSTRHSKTYASSSSQERADDIENGLNITKATTNTKEVEETPVPWRQFSIVLFLQLAEPLTSQVIYPFLPEVRI